MKRLLMHLTKYIYVSDMKTGITHWSRTAVYDFDLPDEYITDTNTLWLEHVHPEDRDLYLTDIMAVLDLLGFILTCCYKAV